MNTFRCNGKIIMGGEELNSIIEGRTKAFVVCDPFIEKSGNIGYITDKLSKKNIHYTVYSRITPDPDMDIIVDGMSNIVEFKPDLIIAMGGGSAIDACKSMMYFARRKELIGESVFIAIPTTSGTGSEVTDFAVVMDKDEGVKIPLIDSMMLPDYAVLDANLTLSVPPAITAATGMDVFTHAVEALVSTESTDFSDAMAEKAIKLVRSCLIPSYKNPNNMVARQGMHNASCLAGIAFNNAGLGLNHGMAHALGGAFSIPHGKANAVLLPYVIGFNAGCFDRLNDNALAYARIARLIQVDSHSIRMSAFNLIHTVKKTNSALGIPNTIKELGINEKDFLSEVGEMAEHALNDKCTKNNPRPCTSEDIEKIYLHAFYGNNAKK